MRFLPSAARRPVLKKVCFPEWAAAALLLLLLAGCAGQQPLPALDEALGDGSTQRAVDALLAGDPEGPLPEPQLPEDLRERSRGAGAQGPGSAQGALGGSASGQRAEGEEQPVVRYRVRSESPDAPELAEAFLAGNSLTRMADVPLHSVTGLEQRLKNALGEAGNILNSFGYYSGTVHGWIEPEQEGAPPSMLVRVLFRPGPQYAIGSTTIIRVDKEIEELASLLPGVVLSAAPKDAPPLPGTLGDVGLAPGGPALADDVLNAVDRVRDSFRNRGYPEAVIVSSRFYLNHEARELHADVRVLPGPFMRMGPVEVLGESSVPLAYLQAKQTWKEGDPWNQDKVEAFRDALRQTGLFLSIDLDPAEQEDELGNRPVMTALAAAPERTVGGAVKYDTNFGPGVQAFWEHRNLSGRGDSLRLELPVWADMQELTAKYRLPFFLRTDQDFIAQAGVLHQDLDAYELQAARLAAGLERRLSRYWSVTAQGSVEGGSIKDPQKPRRGYMMYGLPLGAAFDSSNSLLDATDGGRAIFALAPYTGEYDGDFSILRSRLDLQRFISLKEDESLVLALRGAVGVLSGADAVRVPPSVRFYSGGGGSVRGYAFQSLGPRNSHDDPLGGSALAEVSVEPRLRFSETWGMVAFLDGGMAYEDVTDIGTDMRFGAGVGIRLYTAIGPVRFDVATPLNPRSDDSPLQFYISIGQSF